MVRLVAELGPGTPDWLIECRRRLVQDHARKLAAIDTLLGETPAVRRHKGLIVDLIRAALAHHAEPVTLDGLYQLMAKADPDNKVPREAIGNPVWRAVPAYGFPDSRY